MKFALVSPQDVILEFRVYATTPVAVTQSGIKPRLLPVVLSDIAFDPVTEVREGPVYTVGASEVTETYTKRAKTAQDVAAMKASTIAAIHFIGDVKLASIVSGMQQVQALTGLVQLLYSHTDTTSWPAGERVMVAALRTRLSNIKNVRDTEDSKVTEVQALTTAAQIAAYDVNAGW